MKKRRNMCIVKSSEQNEYAMNQMLKEDIYIILEKIMITSAPIGFNKRKKIIDALFLNEELQKNCNTQFTKAYIEAVMKLHEIPEPVWKHMFNLNNK